jgi:hypothetical protein
MFSDLKVIDTAIQAMYFKLVQRCAVIYGPIIYCKLFVLEGLYSIYAHHEIAPTSDVPIISKTQLPLLSFI